MNEPRPDLNLLVVFDAVASTRSVSEAAKRLSLSQPAVSHALNRLRDLLGDRLFVRGRNGFAPTARAEAMIEPVRGILAAAGTVLAKPVFDPAASRRRFRVAASEYANLAVVPGLVKAVRRVAPEVVLDFVPVGPDTIGGLETGDLDMCFWGTAAPPAPWRTLPLFAERLVGMVGPDHPLARRLATGALGIEDYLAHPHVVVSMRDPGRSAVDQTLDRLGRERRIAVRSQSFIANLELLDGSDLVASVPERLAPLARARGLVVFDLPLELSGFTYLLLWHPRTETDPAAIWLRQTIAAYATGV